MTQKEIETRTNERSLGRGFLQTFLGTKIPLAGAVGQSAGASGRLNVQSSSWRRVRERRGACSHAWQRLADTLPGHHLAFKALLALVGRRATPPPPQQPFGRCRLKTKQISPLLFYLTGLKNAAQFYSEPHWRVCEPSHLYFKATFFIFSSAVCFCAAGPKFAQPRGACAVVIKSPARRLLMGNRHGNQCHVTRSRSPGSLPFFFFFF